MLPSVSLDDDDGSSGVGLAAAAAVSAAMARAWASAASREQRAVAAAAAAAAAAGAGGGGGGSNGVHTGRRGSGGVGGLALADGSSAAPQRAGFRLVATVTTKMGGCLCVVAAVCMCRSKNLPLHMCGGTRM